MLHLSYYSQKSLEQKQQENRNGETPRPPVQPNWRRANSWRGAELHWQLHRHHQHAELVDAKNGDAKKVQPATEALLVFDAKNTKSWSLRIMLKLEGVGRTWWV